MKEDEFQKRISYQGKLEPILTRVCSDFNLGEYKLHRVIIAGYEDFNLVLTTDKGDFFVKIFSSFRNLEECKRYIDIITHAVNAGVQTSDLYKSTQGFLYQIKAENIPIRLCVMRYINGKNFYELKAKPIPEEMCFLVKEATVINKINLKPTLLYDSWAIPSFLQEYKKLKPYLDKEDVELSSLEKRFSSLRIGELPHCFVHGDIIKTNVMKDDQGKIYIIDFAVANYYPRIQELAVLFCNMLFDEDDPESFERYYKLGLTEYQKHIPLTSMEHKILPLYVQLAHAMHVVRATYEKVVNKNASPENEYWLEVGKIGLRYTKQFFSK